MQKHSIVQLRADKHRYLTYSPLTDYSFTADQTTVPLMNFEVASACKCFPIVFPAQQHVIPYAVLGLGEKNIFVDENGKWKAKYLPLMFANYPFSLIDALYADDQDKYHKFSIGIQLDAPHFAQPNGLPLYNENGEPSDILKSIRNSLASQLRRHRLRQSELDQIMILQLLDERIVTVTTNGVTKAVHGLRCVNHDKFLKLPKQIIENFKKSGVMDIINSHWESLANLPVFLENLAVSTS